MDGVRLPSTEVYGCYLKKKIPNAVCCQTLLRILFQIWRYLITDAMIDIIENKKENRNTL